MAGKKAEARERVKAMREEQARKERKRERVLRFGIAGGVLAAVVIIAVAVTATRGGGGGELPSSVNNDGGGIVVGEADAPVTVDYWMDFLCPHCKEFEDTNADALNELADSGDAKIVYHPVTYTGGEYSELANNAFACAADEGKANEFLVAAFENPTQWNNDDLIQIGDDAGVGGDFESCVNDGTYDGWSDTVEDAAGDAEVEGTPTVKVNGEVLESSNWTPEGIKSAVQAAS